jgi:hypothetical protein
VVKADDNAREIARCILNVLSVMVEAEDSTSTETNARGARGAHSPRLRAREESRMSMLKCGISRTSQDKKRGGDLTIQI